MNLSQTIVIYAGGAGSGCHGPNCGRPARSVVKIKGFHAKMEKLAAKAIRGVDTNRMIPRVTAFEYHGLTYEWVAETHAKYMDPRQLKAESRGLALIKRAAKLCGMSERQVQQHIFGQLSLSKDQQWNHGPGYYTAVKDIVKGKTPDNPYSMLVAVRAAITRAYLQKEYGDTVPLYRGVHGQYADDLVRQLKSNGEAMIKTRPAESWSQDKGISKSFALHGGLSGRGRINSDYSVLIHTDIPVNNCVASQKTGFQMRFRESEVSVANPDRYWHVSAHDVAIYNGRTKSLIKKYGRDLNFSGTK